MEALLAKYVSRFSKSFKNLFINNPTEALNEKVVSSPDAPPPKKCSCGGH